MKSNEEKIEEILENFNFEKVHKVMTFLNWTWSGEKVPTSYHLRDEARRLLNEIIKRPEPYIETGGFRAEKDGKTLRLIFVLSEWEEY